MWHGKARGYFSNPRADWLYVLSHLRTECTCGGEWACFDFTKACQCRGWNITLKAKNRQVKRRAASHRGDGRSNGGVCADCIERAAVKKDKAKNSASTRWAKWLRGGRFRASGALFHPLTFLTG